MATGPWDGGRTHHGSYGGGYGGYGGYGGGYAGGYGVGYGSYGGHRRGNYYAWSIELRGSYVWKAALNPFFLLNDTNKLWKNTVAMFCAHLSIYLTILFWYSQHDHRWVAGNYNSGTECFIIHDIFLQQAASSSLLKVEFLCVYVCLNLFTLVWVIWSDFQCTCHSIYWR